MWVLLIFKSAEIKDALFSTLRKMFNIKQSNLIRYNYKLSIINAVQLEPRKSWFDFTNIVTARRNFGEMTHFLFYRET